MCKMCSFAYTAVAVSSLAASQVTASPVSTQKTSRIELPIAAAVKKIEKPTVVEPDWLKQQRAALAAAASQRPRSGVSRSVTYSVTTRGNITASLAEFKTQANQTLNSSNGWARLGISFSEVASGGDFILVLSEASQVPSFSPAGCSSDWSCNVGNYVIINQDRWLYASDAWNSSGGSLRDYRHMVVNHETGHWLGHGHTYCQVAGQPATVMQQQSINLQGCTFNPWPKDNELHSPRLGI